MLFHFNSLGLRGKRPRAGVVGVADEVPAAYVHRRLKVSRAVDKAVGRGLAAGVGMGQRREQVVCVAVCDRGVPAGGGQQPPHAVVRPCAIKLNITCTLFQC